MRVIATILSVVGAAALVAAVGGAAFLWSGHYDVGADTPHDPLVFRLLDSLRRRSIEAQSRDIKVPDLESAAMIAEGAEHYSAMCTGCHLAPGMDDTEIRPGLYPQPPKLADVGSREPRETFWVIKHGIKMSGMPAWGTTHDDAAIWNMVAFVRKLPDISAEQYRAMTRDAAGDDEEHEHQHEHHHDAAGDDPRPAHARAGDEGAHDHAAAATSGAPAQ
jgi:mono/diheme cytochrome c family protein